MLNKHDVVPLYAQLERILREKILTGEFKDGEPIPSEAELTKTYNITRTTVRKAIGNLVQEGLLYQAHGKGTFVRLQEIKYSIWNFEGFTDYLRKRGEHPVSRVLEQKGVRLDSGDYWKLKRARGVQKNEKVLFLTIDTSYIPLRKFAGIDRYDFSRESLYDVMRKEYHVYPRNSEVVIQPVTSDDTMREIFDLDNVRSLLKAKGIVTDERGDELEKVEIVYGPNIEFKLMTKMR
jgi:GntR family transcriptional regulator